MVITIIMLPWSLTFGTRTPLCIQHRKIISLPLCLLSFPSKIPPCGLLVLYREHCLHRRQKEQTPIKKLVPLKLDGGWGEENSIRKATETLSQHGEHNSGVLSLSERAQHDRGNRAAKVGVPRPGKVGDAKAGVPRSSRQWGEL